MTFTQFLLLVAKMREAQKAFYRERRQSALIAAKQAEAEVDDAIRTGIAEIGEPDDARQLALDLDNATYRAALHSRDHTTTAGAPTSSVDERLDNRHG